MRTYLAKIKIPSDIKNKSVGYIGEKIFDIWFKSNYNDEPIFKQAVDRDYQKIDFADHKGYTYQVKTTKAKTYTFNCSLKEITNHLNADFYVFIQIRDEYAYIEPIVKKDEVIIKLKNSFIDDQQCYLHALDLLQQKLFI
jgi:hypothetical protein